MKARSGTFHLAPDRVEEALGAFQKDQLPRYREQSGFKGVTMLVNRSSGKLMGISFWDTDEELKASDEVGDQARAAVDRAGGGDEDVLREEWDVVVDESS